MISASPTHADALRAFVLAALNLDDESEPIDPAPFDADHVLWSERDMPQALPLYAMIREIAYTPIGQTEVIVRPDPDNPEGIIEYHRDLAEWAVSIHLVHKPAGASITSHAAQPGVILRRVWSRTWTELAVPMREIGLAPLRRGPIRNVSAPSGMARWEPRAQFDLVLMAGSYIADRPDWIDSVEVTGTLAPMAPDHAVGTLVNEVDEDGT